MTFLLQNHTSLGTLKKSGLVAAYGDDASDEEEDTAASGQTNSKFNEEELLDLSKMACLLCKRQFPSKDALNK